jgi:leucyl/phenylalanyl-tRNA--protein transferase
VPRRLRQTIRGGRFACTVDRCFQDVMGLCAGRRDEGTWISPEMRVAYGLLHVGGLAHSVEAWPAGRVGEGEPAGGLYGVTIGGAFFAESMFHRVTDAGKAALVFLVERLRERGFLLCDVQWTTPNLRRFGAMDLPRDEYLDLLNAALDRKCSLA